MDDTTPKTGRPKKAVDEARTERLSGIRLTTAELHHVQDLAARAGLDMTEFCRRAILGQRIKAARAATDTDAAYELHRIGVNINQIAHAANIGRLLEGQLTATLSELMNAMERLESHGP